MPPKGPQSKLMLLTDYAKAVGNLTFAILIADSLAIKLKNLFES